MFSKKKRLETQLVDLKEEWEKRQNIIKRLRESLTSESSVDREIDLEEKIKKEEEKREKLGIEIDSLEEKIRDVNRHKGDTVKTSSGILGNLYNYRYYILGVFLLGGVSFVGLKTFNSPTAETASVTFPQEKPDTVDEDGLSFSTQDNQIFSKSEIVDISSVSNDGRVAITDVGEVGIWQIWQSEEGLFNIDRSNSNIIKREDLIPNRNPSVISGSEIEASVIHPGYLSNIFMVIDVGAGGSNIQIAQKDLSATVNIRSSCFLENENINSELYNILINTDKEYIVVSNYRDTTMSQVHVLWLDNGGIENCRLVAEADNGSLNLQESGENINYIARIISTLLDPMNENGFITAHKSGQLFRWDVGPSSVVRFKERLLKDAAEDLLSAEALSSAEFSPDGQYLTLGYSNEIHIWKRNRIFRNDLKPFENFSADDLKFSEITWAGLSDSGEVLIVAGRKNDSKARHHIKFKALSQTGNENTIDCVAYDNNINEMLIVSGKENEVAILSAGEDADSSYSVKLWNYNDLENNESCFK